MIAQARDHWFTLTVLLFPRQRFWRTVTIIDTRRLRLRPWNRSDAPALYELAKDRASAWRALAASRALTTPATLSTVLAAPVVTR